MTTVTIGKAVDTIGFTTVEVAEAEGYFAKQGIKVKEELLSGSSTAYAALQSGGVQFTCASSSSLLAAKEKGVPLEAIDSLDYGTSLQLLVSSNWMKAHHMTANEPIDTTMRDLEGAKFAALSSTDLDYDHLLAKQAGIPTSKYSYITVNAQSSALAGIQHGEMDAFLLSPPAGLQAQNQGTGTVVASLHQIPAFKTGMYDLLVADSNYVKQNPTIAQKVATAMAEADNIMQKDPNAVLKTEEKHYPGTPASVLEQSLRDVTFSKNGLQSASGWKAAEKVTTETGTPLGNLNVGPTGGIWTNEHIDVKELS